MTPRNPGQPARLVLLRHGESEWNARNLFTGWVNVRPDRGRGAGSGPRRATAR